MLIGTSEFGIVEQTSKILENKLSYQGMSESAFLYGDGRAAERIIGVIRYHFGLDPVLPQPYVAA